MVSRMGGKKTVNIKAVLICSGASSCAVVAGFAISFSSVAMDDLSNGMGGELQLTSEQATWFGSLLPLMAIFGSLLSGPIMDYFGRRVALLTVALSFFVSWVLMCQAYGLPLLFIGRGLSGFATGMSTAVIPMYISEVSPSHLRGTMGASFSVALALGLPMGYCSGMWLDWRQVAEIGATTSCISFVIIFMLPESHYWLIRQGRLLEATKAMETIRGSSFDISPEFDDIQLLQKEISDNRVTCADIASKTFLKPVGIGVALMVFQQCSGVNVIFFYAHEIFRKAGFDQEAIASVLASGMQVFSIAFATILVDHVGRRKLLCCSALGMGICHLFIGACMFYINEGSEFADKALDVNSSSPNRDPVNTTSLGHNLSTIHGLHAANQSSDVQDLVVSWACLIFVILYIAMYSIGMGPVPFILLSEMVPFRGRGVACGIGTMSNWLCAFILTKSFINLIELFSVHTVFWMFAAVCFVALIFTRRCVIETSGKTLAEIQDLLAADTRDTKSFANEKKFLSFEKILCHPVSPKACAKSTRSSSVEEQSRDLIDNCADV